MSGFPYWSTKYGCNVKGVVTGAGGGGSMTTTTMMGRGMMAGAQDVLVNDLGSRHGMAASTAPGGEGKGQGHWL
jgi:hypothetical protein